MKSACTDTLGRRERRFPRQSVWPRHGIRLWFMTCLQQSLRKYGRAGRRNVLHRFWIWRATLGGEEQKKRTGKIRTWLRRLGSPQFMDFRAMGHGLTNRT